MSTEEANAEARSEASLSFAKPLIDFGPVVAFFVTYLIAGRFQPEAGIYWATGVLMVATVAALVASRLLLGRFSVPPLVTAGLAVVFGGLTIWLHDPVFLKVKLTIVYLVFSGILGFGLVTGRPLLKLVMGEALRLTDEGWHKLSIRWFVFFLSLALLNEVVWRNVSESAWVNFKFWGVLSLTFVFAFAQVGLIKRYEVKD